MDSMFPVHGLKPLLVSSGMISFFNPKTPLIEGEKIKYSENAFIISLDYELGIVKFFF